MEVWVVERRVDMLHPSIRHDAAMCIAKLARIRPEMHVFETYRSPARQNYLYENGTTKARAFTSPHNFGLAFDLARKTAKGWSWEVDQSVWRVLHREAAAFGFNSPLSWDPYHFVHRCWPDVYKLLNSVPGVSIGEPPAAV